MSNSEPATQLIPEENPCEGIPEDSSKRLEPATLIVEDETQPEDILKSPELEEDFDESKPEDTSKCPEPDENPCETQPEDIFKGPGPATLLLEDENPCQSKPEETLKSPELDEELDGSKPEDTLKGPELCESMQEETSKDPEPEAVTQIIFDETLRENIPEDTPEPDENLCQSMPEETSKDPEPATVGVPPSQSIPEDIFKCSFCREHYDLELRVQKVLDPCGHYLCLKCLKIIFFTGSLQGRQCPTCKSDFSPTVLAPEDFPTNLSVSQILENRAKTNLGECPEHACARKLFCITDQVPVCKYCPEYGDHKGHKVQLVKVLRDKTESKRERLKELLLESVEKKQKREQEIEDSAVKMQEFIIDQFLEMDNLLQTKEEELSEQIKTVLKTETELVINACNENQTLLESKIAEITQEISKNEYGFLTRDASDDENFEPLLEENNDLEAETEVILDRFLKTIDSLKPVPKQNEASTQTFEKISETLLQNDQRIPKFKSQQRKSFKSAAKENQEPEPEPEPASMKAEEQLSPSKKTRV